METKFNDRLARYAYGLKKRYSKKGKQKFITTLLKDIAITRNDFNVIEYQYNKKATLSNIYIGDIKKADKIICTYYDTPPFKYGDYYFFNRDKQNFQTIVSIIFNTLLWLIIGIGLVLKYMQIASDTFKLVSLNTLILAIIFFGYFYALKKIASGDINKYTVIRNTSSVLCLLSLIDQTANNKVAYAFIDYGATNDSGLKALISENKKADIYLIDSIGADAKLYYKGSSLSSNKLNENDIEKIDGKTKVNYIFAAKKTDDKYYLTKSLMKAKNINMHNYNQVKKILENIIK